MAHPTVLTLAERRARYRRPKVDGGGTASRGQSVMECSPTPRASAERNGERFHDFTYQLCF